MRYKIIASGTDPGGINAISPVIKALGSGQEFEVRVVATDKGSRHFFRNKIQADEIISEYPEYEALCRDLIMQYRPDLILIGTSRIYSIERELTKQAKIKGIPVIAVLDYWAFYEERFLNKAKQSDTDYLPDRLCIMDKTSFKEIVSKTRLPENILRITGNPYLDNIREGAAKYENNSSVKSSLGLSGESRVITFVSEPLALDFGDGLNSFSGELGDFLGYTETDVFNALKDILSDISQEFKEKIDFIIKLHPRETKEFALMESEYLKPRLFRDEDPREIISISNIVIGMISMLLFEAALMGRKVYSYQPNLRQPDFCITDKLGLSRLISDERQLRAVLKQEIASPRQKIPINIDDYIQRDATDNVIKEIMACLSVSKTQ